MNVGLRDLCIVVRAADERTKDAAVRVLAEQFGPSQDAEVTVVRERPFSEAVRQTMRAGLASRRAWTIGMDADVLLVRDGLEKLRAACEEAAPATFTVTTLMLCRFYGGLVFRGIHCYRTELLHRALPLIGLETHGGPDPRLKPESAVCHAMAERGFGSEGRPVVVAAHDFEQSFRHIYLKMRMRARREEDPAGLTAFLGSRADADADFRVALWGVEDGLADRAAGPAAPGHYDWYADWPEFDRRMAEAGLSEKGAFPAEAGPGYADRVLAAHSLESDTRTPRWIRERLLGRKAA